VNLNTLFHAITRPVFDTHFFRRAPCAQAGAASGLVHLFDWSTLDRVLARDAEGNERESDVLVVNRGKILKSQAAPRSLAEARPVMDAGASLVVRRAQTRDTGLGELALNFSHELGGAVQIQLFITPRAGQSFGWHYDAEDVFILQTIGVKNYYFRANTVNPRPSPQRFFDFSAIQRERSPLLTCALAPGDWLYLPAGFWHVAKAEEDSLGISVGLLADRATTSNQPARAIWGA
jgi:50S ribosomal protein L16 3-hydroxylase